MQKPILATTPTMNMRARINKARSNFESRPGWKGERMSVGVNGERFGELIAVQNDHIEILDQGYTRLYPIENIRSISFKEVKHADDEA